MLSPEHPCPREQLDFKGEIIMPYVKPQIKMVTGAIKAIRSTSARKGYPFVYEFSTERPTATTTAYEADE